MTHCLMLVVEGRWFRCSFGIQLAKATGRAAARSDGGLIARCGCFMPILSRVDQG